MVVGGGIAGLTAAYELTRHNISVELVEKSCFLGGHGIGFTCKATDECRQCGACSVEKMLSDVVDSPLVNIHLRTRVVRTEKTDRFRVTLEKSDVGDGLMRGYSHNNKPFYVSGKETGYLPEGTVMADELGFEGDMAVDAVVLATGYDPFDPDIKSTYGYSGHTNVITGMELENILRDHTRLVRPSDGTEPDKVAFIQCVGSRDERLGNLWCSVVCCPYAMRMASLTKYNKPDTDISIFYIDIQNTGKEFPFFLETVKEDARFLRTIPVDIYPEKDDRLTIRYMLEEDGNPVSETYDLVVLSVGIMPGKDNKLISEQFGSLIDEHGFLCTSPDGVFLAGTVKGPKTIAGTMADAQKAALDLLQFVKGGK